MENVIENNKFIAEFMEYPFHDIEHREDPEHYEIWEDELYSEKELQFHSSWNWIMPVVEKIDQILPDDNLVTITYNRCLIEYFQEGITIEGLGNTRIEATYKAVVEFIKWYNQQSE